jgi:hypothetical protein
MVTIHKIQFTSAKNQEEVWIVYRNLKLQRKGKTMVEILQEISRNWNELSNLEISEEKAKELKVLGKIKKTPHKLVSLLKSTTDPELKTWLRQKIKDLIEEEN